MLYRRGLMANETDWAYMFPAVKIPFELGCEFQIEAVMNKALKNRPKLPDVGLKSAA
jgi:hypothetical protein